MTLILDNVSKRSVRETWIQRGFAEPRAWSLNVLLGPTLAGKTSLMRLMAGPSISQSTGRMLVDDDDVTGLPVQQAQRRHGLPAVHQLPDPDRLREHRLAAAGRAACRKAEIDRAGARHRRRCCSSTPYLDAHAARAFRRPAAAHRDRPRAGQGRGLLLLDEPLANLDYKLREELRAELPRSSRPPARSSSTPPPSRTRRCSSAATPRRCREGRVMQFGPTARSIASRRPASPRGLQRSADELMRCRKRGDGRSRCRRRPACRAAGPSRRSAGRPLHASGSGRITSALEPHGAELPRAGDGRRSPRSPARRPSSTSMRRERRWVVLGEGVHDSSRAQR